MGIEQFARDQNHTRTTATNEDSDGTEGIFDVIYDNPDLLALLHTTAGDGDLTRIHTALAELHPTGKDDLDHTVLIAELLVRLIFTHPSPTDDPQRNANLAALLREHGLSHGEHFECTLISVTLEHGLSQGHLDAEVYDIAEHYTTHHHPEFAHCLNGIERLPRDKDR